MAEAQRSYKRRHFFIKKGFQFRFILKFCLIVMIGAILSTGILFLVSQGTLTSSFENSRLVVQKTSLAIMPAVLWTNLITLILITLATIFVVLFVSHKIAGPLFRFEKELREIATGDLTKTIHLRKKDQITDMAGELNAMTASLHEKMLAIRSDLEKTIESATRENVSPELMEALNRLHRSMEMHFKI